jgi:hypothetical protein
MNGRNLIRLAMGLLLIAALDIFWRSFHSARGAEAAWLRLENRRAALEAEISNADRRWAAAQHALENLALKRSALDNTAAARPARKPRMSAEAALRSNPRLQALYFENLGAQQRNNSAPLYHALGLSPEQILQMDDINLRAAERRMDLRWAAEAQGTSLADPAYLALQRQVTEQAKADTGNVLGEAGAQQLQALLRAAPVNYVVGQVGAAVAQTATPLSADQAAQLTQLLANASGDYQGGRAAALASVDWNAALSQAQGLVSAPQLAALQATVATYQESQALTELIQMARPARGN